MIGQRWRGYETAFAAADGRLDWTLAVGATDPRAAPAGAPTLGTGTLATYS